MNILKRAALAKRALNAVKTGTVSGFVLAWAVSCPYYISFLASGNLGSAFLVPFLLGLFLSLTAMASTKIKHYFISLPWYYVSLSASLLLFVRLFPTGSLYFSLSSFLLGICVFYLLNHLAVLFIKSEEPVYLAGTTLLIVILISFLADTYLYSYPEQSNLLSFVLSFSITIFFLTTKKEREDGFNQGEYVRTFFCLNLDKGILRYLLLLLFCFFTVFLIYMVSTFYLNNSLMLGYGYRLYAATYLLYFAAVVFFSYITGKYNPSYSLGYCISVFACAVALAAATFDSVWFNYLYFFLYSISAAGLDLFTFLIIVFLAKQTNRSVYFILGLVFYWLTIELSSSFGVSKMPLYDTHLISLFIIILILLAFPFLASKHMILPLRNAQSTLKVKEQILGEQTSAGDEIITQLELTVTEKKVYQLICRGLSNADIAVSLNISQNTVKFHVRNILQKAGVKNRFELVTSRHTSKGAASRGNV